MKFVLQENKEEFEFKSDKKNFDIRFNRVAFIFFIFFLIFVIYCIHLTHLGSRDLNLELDNVKLEFDYLSSAEKLINYQNLYFENKLTQKSINEIEIINFTREKIFTNDVKIIDSEK